MDLVKDEQKVKVSDGQSESASLLWELDVPPVSALEPEKDVESASVKDAEPV